MFRNVLINPLNAELNPICHLPSLLGAHHILHVSRIRGKVLVLNVTIKLFDIASLSRGPKNYDASSSLCSITEQGYKYP